MDWFQDKSETIACPIESGVFLSIVPLKIPSTNPKLCKKWLLLAGPPARPLPQEYLAAAQAAARAAGFPAPEALKEVDVAIKRPADAWRMSWDE